MADRKISELNSLTGSALATGDLVAVVDTSASETKKLTVGALIENGVDLIADDSIPGAKILFGTGEVAGTALADGGVATAKVADDAITAAKIANEATCDLVTTLPASGGYTGQLALDTDDNKIYIWDGSAWQSVKGAGSVNTVVGSSSGLVNITISTSGDEVTITPSLDNTTAGAQFLAGPTGAAGAVSYRAIAGSDLPTATSSTKGAVTVDGNGLTLSGTEIQINNTVTAETTEHHVVQYDANGLITGGRTITATDVPAATSTAKGGVFPGSGLSVESSGQLNHSNSVATGTYTKVTVDGQGHVSAAENIVAADVPDLDASKTTTGTFPTARLANAAITAAKLADSSVTKFGGAGATDNVVVFPDGDFKGQFFFDEKNEDLYIYTGESFLPITVISGNLVNAGTYDASTNQLSSVTTAGSAAGFTNGAALPAPATGNLNYYVVVDTSGTGSGNAPAEALAPPDMLISLGTGSTFQLIDVSNAIAGQTAANISVVATGNIAATDVQAALQELDTEKLAKAGGTMTGNLELGDGVVIVFEGATDDGFETTLTVTDPTADRTITLPNETGTVVTTGSSGVVTSTMITDGTIVNADISASAEIAVSKLANGTARQLLQTDVAGTGVEFTSNVDVPGTLDVTGAATFDSTAAVTGALTVTGVINADGKVKFPAGTASAPSFYSGTDTDTGLYFSAANEISVATGGTQRIAVDSSGRVLIGTASSIGFIGGTAATLQAINTGSQYALGMERATNDSAGPVCVFRKTRSTSNGGNTIVSSSDDLGYIRFSGTDGAAAIQAAEIKASVDGTPGSNDMPGRLVFSTTADGASSPTERLRIDSSGNLGLGTSSPGQLLHLSSASPRILLTQTSANSNAFLDAATSGVLELSADDNNVAASSSMRFKVDGSEAMRIDSSGHLLFGGVSNSTAKVKLINETDGGGIYVRAPGNQPTWSAFRVIDSSNSDANSAIIYSNGGAYFADKVGIGTTSPAQKLHVASAASTYVQVQNTGDSVNAYYGVDTGGAWVGASTNHPLKLHTNNTERLRVDSSGRLLVGTSTIESQNTFVPRIQLSTTGAEGLGLCRFAANAGAQIIGFAKSRGTSVNAHAVVNSGDTLGTISFAGDDGTNLASLAGLIQCVVDGTPGSNDMPGRLVFSTTADGASSSTERLRISSKGVVTVKNSSVGEIDALTSASTITPDFAASNNFSVTLGTNATLANPSNLTAGQSGVIAITQDSTGSRTLAYGSKFKFAGGTAPTLTTTASAVDILTYYVESTSRITAQVLLNVS